MIISRPNKTSDSLLVDFAKRSDIAPYIAITEGIEVAVWPEFIDSQATALGNIFIWTYHIRIENKGSETIKLTNRHWRIIDEQGAIQEVDGEGVVGEKPIITVGEYFQYTSSVHLRYPSGIMSGYYQMQKDDGISFEVKVPAFSLDAPLYKSNIN